MSRTHNVREAHFSTRKMIESENNESEAIDGMQSSGR